MNACLMKDERRKQAIYNNAGWYDQIYCAYDKRGELRRSGSTGMRSLSLKQPVDQPGEKVKT